MTGKRIGDAERPAGFAGRLAALPKATLVALTAAAALIAALTGLVFDIWPELRPDPRTHLGADLAVFAVERNVTYGQWMERSSGSKERWVRRRTEYVAGDGGEGGLSIEGEMALVKVAVLGFKRRGIFLQYALYDARSQHRVERSSGPAQVNLEAPTDEFVAELWLPEVSGPRRYVLRVEARASNGTLLSVADSKPFRGL